MGVCKVPKSVSYYLDGISFQLEFYSLMNFAGVSFEGEHTPGVNFTNVLRKAFRCAEKMTDCIFSAFGICARKSCS